LQNWLNSSGWTPPVPPEPPEPLDELPPEVPPADVPPAPVPPVAPDDGALPPVPLCAAGCCDWAWGCWVVVWGAAAPLDAWGCVVVCDWSVDVAEVWSVELDDWFDEEADEVLANASVPCGSASEGTALGTTSEAD
jgi:hypothetical protein